MKNTVLFALLALVLFSGCVQTKVEKMESRLGSVEQQSFPTVEGAKLELAVSGNPELVSGKDRSVTFILRNLSSVPISIPEWYTNEPDNIEVSIQVWFPGSMAPEEDRWITYHVVPKKPVMIVKPGTERRYFIKARLNLKSVEAESKVSAITIRAKEDAEKAEKSKKMKK